MEPEWALPSGLVVDRGVYDAWFRAKVQEGCANAGPAIPHAQVMDEMQALIERKRNGRAD